MAVYFRADFQDSPPFAASRPHTALANRNLSPNTSALGTAWDYTHVAPGASHGGYNDRGYVRVEWFGTVGGTVSTGFGDSGYHYNPSGSGAIGSASWPTSGLYGRLRIYCETGIVPSVGGDDIRQFKFFIAHTSVFDGDERVIGFLESGDNGGESNATHVCFTLTKNINSGPGEPIEAARVVFPVGQ